MLTGVRLEGAIFLRAEYTEAWSYESLDGPTTAEALRPGSERVTLFHLVAAGRCWISLPGGTQFWADAGDVIVIPYGDEHLMGGREPVDPVSIATFLPPLPWTEFPVLRHGRGGERTEIVCGYLHTDDPLFDPRLKALPPLFVVRPDHAAAQWVRASIDYAMASSSLATQLPELLLAEVLRLHLTTARAADHGLLAALRDPILAPALARLHAEPERKWEVATLAAEVATSRSVLDDRFRQVLGRAPMRYLNDWRMHLANDLLATTNSNIAAIARTVGYDSEEAFSRAFRKARGVPPSTWRARRHAP